jgi:hypothetical protein
MFFDSSHHGGNRSSAIYDKTVTLEH